MHTIYLFHIWISISTPSNFETFLLDEDFDVHMILFVIRSIIKNVWAWFSFPQYNAQVTEM